MKLFCATMCICLLATLAAADPVGPMSVGQRASEKTHRKLQSTDQHTPNVEKAAEQDPFQRFDTYGKMNANQMERLGQYENSPSFKEHASNAFNMYDSNADGFLDVTEVRPRARGRAVSRAETAAGFPTAGTSCQPRPRLCGAEAAVPRASRRRGRRVSPGRGCAVRHGRVRGRAH